MDSFNNDQLFDHNKCIKDGKCTCDKHKEITGDYFKILRDHGANIIYKDFYTEDHIDDIQENILGNDPQIKLEIVLPSSEMTSIINRFNIHPYIIGYGGIPYYSNYFYILREIGISIPLWFYEKYKDNRDPIDWIEAVDQN